MDLPEWAKNFPGSITICDPQGVILAMNDKSAISYAKDGGLKLIGTNMLDCHPEPARSKVKEMLDKQILNVYSIEKHGVKKLIYQTPWVEDGHYRGFIELALEVPFEMPHFVRS